IKELLKNKFNLECDMKKGYYKNGEKYFIRIKKESINDFINIVKQYN
ncbi:hypothetical protein LCGC14_1796070, partial [marine sediment metagenome]